MGNVPGTIGYRGIVERFIDATGSISFADLHQPYLDLIPAQPGRILDVGAGVGRDAAILAGMGHRVTAVEPLPEFLSAARRLNHHKAIYWLEDALPLLASLDAEVGCFDFVLASAVWHHLSVEERAIACSRIAKLTKSGGIFALSLRHGPAGQGRHVFPTDLEQTLTMALSHGFKVVVAQTNLPSQMPNKSGVTWSKVALERM